MLAGITVVDFSRYLPGPYCTMRLADMGAEVIKVEGYPACDPGRTTGPQVDGCGVLYVSTNRNKRAIALNLRTAEGRELAFALARQADVLVESYRPGVMRHLGLDYESLRAVKPDMIYCSLTGYGQSGTMHQLGGHDLNYQAISGFLSATRDADGRPVVSEVPIADYAGGLYAAEQICAALVRRERTGEGCFLDIASVDVLATWMGLHVMLTHAGEPDGMRSFLNSLINYRVYETADGRYVALAALEEKFWHNFCHAVGREDWEGYAGQSVDECPDVYEELKALFLTRTQAEWSELGVEVDCCLTAVEEMDTWADSTYVTGRQLVIPMPGQQSGRILHVRGERLRPVDDHLPPPAYGADTHDVLRSRLGLTDDELRHYADHGIIPQGGTKR